MGEGTRVAPPRPPRGPGAGDLPAIPDLHHYRNPKPVHGWMGPVDKNGRMPPEAGIAPGEAPKTTTPPCPIGEAGKSGNGIGWRDPYVGGECDS